MKRVIREPLLHFLVLGIGIFVAYQWMRGEGVSTKEQIVVTPGRIEAIATGFARTWQRPPSPEELDGLVRDYVREEVASREAIGMGLDRDDVVIRRRLRQKLEFISDAAQKEPTDAELQAYLDTHRGQFEREQQLSFEQIYFDRQRHSAGDVSGLLPRLRQDATGAESLGDSTMLEHRFDDLDAGEVTRRFGAGFTEKLGSLPVGEWAGPVESGYGLHLVRVTARRDAQARPLADVRDEVRREWTSAQRQQAQDRFYDALLAKYSVRIERPGKGRELAGVR